jgi:acetyl esterase/lipase
VAPTPASPPTLTRGGTGEVLVDDARLFHEKLSAAGVACRLSAIDAMEHVAVVRGLDMPGSAETLDAVVAFIAGIIARNGTSRDR